MTLFLDRIDAAPIINKNFDAQFLQWLAVLVDSLNENISDIQNAFNLLTVPNVEVLNETVTLTSGSPSFSVANGSLYSIDENVVGNGIPAGSTISTIDGNVITLTNDASINGASLLAFIPSDGVIGNGIMLYDTTTNQYLGIENGALVKFTTTAYP